MRLIRPMLVGYMHILCTISFLPRGSYVMVQAMESLTPNPHGMDISDPRGSVFEL